MSKEEEEGGGRIIEKESAAHSGESGVIEQNAKLSKTQTIPRWGRFPSSSHVLDDAEIAQQQNNEKNTKVENVVNHERESKKRGYHLCGSDLRPLSLPPPVPPCDTTLKKQFLHCCSANVCSEQLNKEREICRHAGTAEQASRQAGKQASRHIF